VQGEIQAAGCPPRSGGKRDRGDRKGEVGSRGGLPPPPPTPPGDELWKVPLREVRGLEVRREESPIVCGKKGYSAPPTPPPAHPNPI